MWFWPVDGCSYVWFSSGYPKFGPNYHVFFFIITYAVRWFSDTPVWRPLKKRKQRFGKWMLPCSCDGGTYLLCWVQFLTFDVPNLPNLRMETNPFFKTLCPLVFRILDDGQSLNSGYSEQNERPMNDTHIVRKSFVFWDATLTKSGERNI
jgi:hypothetical protein